MRLTVAPRELKSQLTYFDDKVKGQEPAGQETGETKRTAHGILERRTEGRWIKVWDAPLANEVAPVAALVSNDGKHVVTFDNWHSMGFGDNVVVIYGNNGRLMRALRLDQILPVAYINALPRSVSSLWWSGKHRLPPDSRRLLLAVAVPGDGSAPSDRHATVDVAVDLDTGAVIPPSDDAWDRALARATQVSRERDAAEAARNAAFHAPLHAPTTAGDREWHDYLRESFFRLDPDWKDSYPSTMVLRSPSVRDYKVSENWVREALDGTDGSKVVMLAAPAAPDRLVTVVEEVARNLSIGKLKAVRIYVAAPDASAKAISAALTPSGAEVVALDLTASIPQRPERLSERMRASNTMAAAELPLTTSTTAPTPGAASNTIADNADLAALADALEALADDMEATALPAESPKGE
jgi:hypothetical protein